MSSAKSGSRTDNLSLVGGNEPAATTITGWGSAKLPSVAHVKWAVGHPSPFATLLECSLTQIQLSHMNIWYVAYKVRQANHLCFARLTP